VRIIYSEDTAVILTFRSGSPPGVTEIEIISPGGDQITDASGNNIAAPS
jgi:hypothetical protein